MKENGMDIEIETVQARVPVTVVTLHGRIDGSNYEQAIDVAKQLYASGTRSLLLDFTDVSFMSSAGLVALHKIILLLRGEKIDEAGAGWDALHAIAREDASASHSQVKILNPQPKVASTLEMSGMDRFVEIYSDSKTALDSF
jgi:anti-anti-sigma factor